METLLYNVFTEDLSVMYNTVFVYLKTHSNELRMLQDNTDMLLYNTVLNSVIYTRNIVIAHHNLISL